MTRHLGSMADEPSNTEEDILLDRFNLKYRCYFKLDHL